MLLAQAVEDHDGVDAVEELRLEGVLQLAEHLVLHAVVLVLRHLVLIRALHEADSGLAVEQGRADVRRHDDDRVAEVHRAALGVGQLAVFENLKQHVEDIGVRLLDLVEQDHAVGLAAHASVSWPPSS